MIPARPLCEAGRRRIAIVAEPVIRHGLPDVYSPGRLLLWPGGVAERLCRLLQRACNAIFLGL